MKGVIFTLLLDMVEDSFGPQVTENIISASNLPSGGAYTAVGTYDHAEIVSLVTNLSKETDIAVPDLIRVFGKHLLGQFYRLYPDFFTDIDDVLVFLEQVDSYIHCEVLKLYPDAKLPKIETTRLNNEELELIYKSDRMMGDLAEGLITGAIEHFGGGHTFTRQDVEQGGPEQCVHFKIKASVELAA